MTQSATPASGPWVVRWLSAPRYAKYLEAASGDEDLALALYEWNAQLRAALLHDLAHLEVGLRNSFDAAITARWHGEQPWVFSASTFLAPVMRGTSDKSSRSRKQLEDQAESERQRAANADESPMPGKVVAELSFGFWSNLTVVAQDAQIWQVYLQNALGPRIRRREVDDLTLRLNRLRNRAAHHEPLLRPVTEDLARLQRLAMLLDPELGRYIVASSTVWTVVARDPRQPI